MPHDAIERLRVNIADVFVGNKAAIDQLIVCLLARGHALIEDVPGVGKTVLATALARSIDCTFSRVQLTPDLLPADVLGVSILDRDTSEFRFKAGPIFANIFLADEINRTTPRTQSALLESMSEGTVSVDGRVLPLEQPFMVVATQNPYAFEGTYPLPENQLDRFLMQIRLGYPSPEDEARVIASRPADTTLPTLKPVMHGEDVIAAQRAVDAVRMDPALIEYIVAVGRATREHPEVRVGLSPRGTMAVSQAARATAFMDGRDYCIPEDITSNLIAVGGHRLITKGHLGEGGTSIASRVLGEALHDVPSPA